ncbi:FecCD family ABC transporter permease [Lichenibacterium dinghuense]|uniref:FecCD family ABC transporter permease n=1 Tax=Lichenibacterium dinghuense TaxID=2895977 RepID=UPI001F2B751C|nr:iron ABC transporter permease [Lichenibacterium sp. 6Y81]
MRGDERRARRPALVCAAGLALVLALALLGIAEGATPLPFGSVLRVLLAPLAPGLDAGVGAPLHRIVLDLRLPRVILAACTGSGLAVVGALLQTTTRNDLADPFLFGLSSGAAAGAVSVITLFGYRLGPWTLPAAAFAGALLSAAIVFGLVSTQNGRGGERLVLAGLATSFLFGAVTLFLVFAGDQRATTSVLFWSVGGLGLAAWDNLPVGLAGAGVAIATGLGLRAQLDALLAGEDTAASLGVDVRRLRGAVFLLCALSTAALVALAGVIGFVGLMVPHVARALVGVRHGPLVATSALMGAALLLGGDLVSRTVLAPQELPVGIVTAAAGGLFVLALVVRRPGA